jgi:hypothetical protein
MEGAASIDRDESWTLLDALQVGGGGRTNPPFDRGGVKYSQAVITQTRDGQWKMFIQSDRQVEMSLTGTLEDVVKELKFAATREWQPAALEWERLR